MRYLTPRLNKVFGSYFLVFGKCGVTPHRLYRGSLTLSFNVVSEYKENESTQRMHCVEPSYIIKFSL